MTMGTVVRSYIRTTGLNTMVKFVIFLGVVGHFTVDIMVYGVV